jgi:hypothetical protein
VVVVPRRSCHTGARFHSCQGWACGTVTARTSAAIHTCVSKTDAGDDASLQRSSVLGCSHHECDEFPTCAIHVAWVLPFVRTSVQLRCQSMRIQIRKDLPSEPFLTPSSASSPGANSRACVLLHVRAALQLCAGIAGCKHLANFQAQCPRPSCACGVSGYPIVER